MVDVPLSDGTVLCTAHGGFVRRTDLAVGQKVAVWLPAVDSKAKIQALGAVAIMLASKDPNDDWP